MVLPEEMEEAAVLLDETEDAAPPDIGLNLERDNVEIFPPSAGGVADWDLHSHPATNPEPTASTKGITDRLISITAFWQRARFLPAESRPGRLKNSD